MAKTFALTDMEIDNFSNKNFQLIFFTISNFYRWMQTLSRTAADAFV